MDKMLYATLAVAGTACMVAGCATTPIAASADSLSMLQGQQLTVVTDDPHAGYMQMTTGYATFAAIGAIAAAADSSDLAKKYDIVNPSGRVAAKLRLVLIKNLKPSAIKSANARKDGDTLAATKKGLVFAVSGSVLSNYFPLDWTHYRIQYDGAARLIDAGTGKVVAQAPCKYESNDKNPPTYDQLYANNAALLKTKLQAAADLCADQIVSAIFKS